MVFVPYIAYTFKRILIGLRLVAAAKGKTLAAEKIGKIKTVIQLLCISCSWPIGHGS